MPKRLRKYVRRLLIALLIVGALGVAAFSYICYWPLEGRVEDMGFLVPRLSEFVLRGSYEDLAETGWFDKNVFDDPLHPSLREFVDIEWPRLQRQIEDTERQINEQIPLGLVEVSAEKDALEGELIIAGRFCRGARPELGGPRWQEILILKRLPFWSRAGLAAALGHEWVRDMAGTGGRVVFDRVDNDVYRLTLTNVRPSPVRNRSGCAPGYIMPPENVWFVHRVKDVLAFSNSESLIQDVAALAETRPGSGESFVERPDFEIEPRAGSVVAGVELDPLHDFLQRAEDRDVWGREMRLLTRFLTIDALDKLNGWLSFENPNLLHGKATIKSRPTKLSRSAKEVYRLAPQSVRSGLASLVPAADTYAFAMLRIPPMELFRAIVGDLLQPGDKKLWEDNLRTMGEYESLEDFFSELAERLGDTAAVALGRLSDTFDRVEYEDWYSDEHDPFPAFAFMVPIREGANQQEVDEFLRSRIPLLGFESDAESVQRGSVTYTRLRLRQQIRDYALFSPCYILAQQNFVFASNEDYFLKILDTLTEPSSSMAADEAFRVTMSALPPEGHLAVYVDLEKLSRIPETPEQGGQPRGVLWDERNLWIMQHRDVRAAAIEKRQELEEELNQRMKRLGQRPTPQQLERIDEEVDRFAELHMQNYPTFVREYWESLFWWRRFRSVGLVVSAEQPQLHLESVLLLREAEPWAR